MTGRIIKGIAGFYYVHDGKNVYECKAKGIFRKNKEKPLVGDDVDFSVISESEKTGNINAILERRSCLIRPEVANVDKIFLCFAAETPEPNYDMINKYLIMVADSGIKVDLVLNKTDLVSEEKMEKIRDQFINTGLEMFFLSAKTGAGLSELRERMTGQTSAFAGPSGVGKSSMMNCFMETEVMETGELSRKIDRGKQTTRHTELFYLGENTFLLDTPGFTSVDIDYVLPQDLKDYYAEFEPYLGKCRFNTCNHLKEPDCAVKQAVSEKMISRSRYGSYVSLYEYLSGIRRY